MPSYLLVLGVLMYNTMVTKNNCNYRKILTTKNKKSLPLLPRMKQSPYFSLSRPSEYSSVCSIAMFINPSRQANTPESTTPA